LNGIDKNKEELYHRELETILRFGALVNSSLNIETVLDHAMKWAEEFMEAEASSVYELDDETGELFIRIARGEKKEPIRGIRLKVGEGVAGRVVGSGKPIMIQDVNRDKNFSDKFDKRTGFRTRSMICVPLILRGRPMGALQVINKKTDAPFTQTDLELLTGMAQQIAVALENAKLYQRLQAKFKLTENELKKTQEKLIRSERLSAMGNLVQGIAHEIRNPIMTIGGFARRIKGTAKKLPRVSNYADIILEESGRLESLVRQIRDFAETLKAELRPTRIEAVIEEVYKKIEPQALDQQVTLELHMDEDLPRIRMDYVQLARALLNISRNALEAMTDGGILEIRVATEDQNLTIDITDTGRGIGQEDLDSVYDPFFTSKTRGAGLGLTMAHQIVMNHQGDIRIRSTEGEGTSVTIRIPISRD
jgi:signal transduction histidine kinase